MTKTEIAIVAACGLAVLATNRAWGTELPPIALEAGAGAVDYGTQKNGTWYQKGYPYEFDLRDTTVRLGAVARLSERARVDLAYVDLGRTHSFCVAVSDDDYARGVRGPLYRINGDGRVRGVHASLAYDVARIGPARLSLNAGEFVFQPTWEVVARMPDGSMFTAHHRPTVQNTWTVGAALAVGRTALRVDYYNDLTANGDLWPSAGRNAVAATVVVSF